MTSRLGFGIAAAVVMVLLVCSGLVGLFGGAASGGCVGPAAVSGGPDGVRSRSAEVGRIGRGSAEQAAYAKWAPDATQIVGPLTGNSRRAGCMITVSAVGWTHPAPGAALGSGFRTSERPSHDGIDLIAGRGTAIRAAAAGTVSRVRCNAVDVRTGADWGCDRDGDPDLTNGCGWYVDIDHQGFLTRYCHMLTRPYVQIGLVVKPGDVIGVVGSSGHSSGPHLHYEVHRGADHSSASAIDPIGYMRSAGVPLG